MAKFKIQKKIDTNGNTEDIELDGYQEEITTTNKLSSDLVDDTNSTNKFVTSNEKETWNNKANTSDIPTKTSQLTNDSDFATIEKDSTIADSIILDNYYTKTQIDNKYLPSDGGTLTGKIKLNDYNAGIYDDKNNGFIVAGTSFNIVGNNYKPLYLAGSSDRPIYRVKSGYIYSLALKDDIPTNYVTTDTEQTITGNKTFSKKSLKFTNPTDILDPTAVWEVNGSGPSFSISKSSDGGIADTVLNINAGQGKMSFNTHDIITDEDEVYQFANKEYNKTLNLLNVLARVQTINGVTLTIDNSGKCTWSGTATSGAGFDYTDVVNLKPNTTYTLKVFNQTNNIPISVYFWDYVNGVSYGGIELGSTINGSDTFTTPSNISNNVKLDSYVNNGSISGSFSVMLVEGTTSPSQFYSYNANKHITNEQAALLADEYNKSANLLTPNNAVNTTKYIMYLESNNNYCISANLSNITNAYTGEIFRYNPSTNTTSSNDGAITRTYKSFNTAGRHSYTLTCNITGWYQIETFNVGSGNISNITLNKGLLDLGYTEYNGAIIHEKDLGVLLWKNGSPNSQQASSSGTLAEKNTNYENLVFEIKPYWYSEAHTTVYITVKTYKNTDGYQLSKSRVTPTEHFITGRIVTFSNGLNFTISDCSKSNFSSISTDNSRFIITAIYGKNHI